MTQTNIGNNFPETVWRHNIEKGNEQIREPFVDTFEMEKHWESDFYTVSHQHLSQIVS